MNLEELEGLLASYLRERLVRPATADTYRKVLRRWRADTGISVTAEVTRSAVIDWRNLQLEGRGVRPETFNRNRRHMRALLNHAVSLGVRDDNPFSAVPPARTGTRLKKTVETDLLTASLEILDREDEPLKPAWLWRIIIRAYFYTGVRRRQLVELNWGDIDFSRRIWRIRAETCKTHREWEIPFDEAVVEEVRALRAATECRLGRPPRPGEQVFRVPLFYDRYVGPRLTGEQVGGFFARLSRLVGAQISPHRLRHTMATLLAPNDVKTLQEILGHTNITTTLGYFHPDVDRMRALVGNLPRIGDGR